MIAARMAIGWQPQCYISRVNVYMHACNEIVKTAEMLMEVSRSSSSNGAVITCIAGTTLHKVLS